MRTVSEELYGYADTTTEPKEFMKITKQLIAILLVSAGVFTGKSQNNPPATTSRADDVLSGGGGRAGAGIAPGRAVSPAAGASAYAQNDFGGSYGYVSSSKSSGSSVPPVVIQFGSKGPEAIATMEDDLAVMTHIIDGALDRMGDDVPDEKMGIKLYYTSGGKSVRALYLENFGPLFMVKVNFPVHAPTVTEAKVPDEPDDSEWNRARRDLFGFPEDTRWTGSSGGVPYEAERVEALKKQLVAALTNASNMKGVRPEEHVTVTVFGSPAATNGEATRERRSSSSGSSSSTSSSSRGQPARVAVVVERNKVTQLENARASSHGTVLTLRLKKADIDAAGKDGAEALVKKAIVNTYAGNGHGLSSVNSWIKSSSSSGVRAR
jgi:hypothetical protein